MLILFLRSISNEHQMGLFEMPTMVAGHVKKDGTMVAPYVARRKRSTETHHAVQQAKPMPLVLFPKGNDNQAMENAKTFIQAWDNEFEAAYGDASGAAWSSLKNQALALASRYGAATSEDAAKYLKHGNDNEAFAEHTIEVFFRPLKAAGWPDPRSGDGAIVIGDAAHAAWGTPAEAPAVNIAPEEVLQPIGLPNKRDVPDYLVPRVEAIIEKVNRRAAKLGVEGFKLVKGEAYEKKIKGEHGGPDLYTVMIPCTIEGPKIKAPGGWQLEGRVDFEDGSIIVNSRPGHELPTRYRSISPTCEHCKSDRQRNAVFVFGDGDGKYLQVGRQCLKDYLGHDPAATLWAASEFGGIFDDIDGELDEDRASGGRASQLVSLDDVMTAAAWAVRKHGFVSAKAASERGGLVSPTSVDVSAALFDKKYRPEYLKGVTQADKDKAAAVVAWIQAEWGSKPDTSDYEYNAVELTARRAVHIRRIGLLTSLIAAYDRAHEEKVAREKRVDAYVGKVGERRDFKATFAGENSFDTAYGVMWIGRFDTPEGLLVYRGSTPFWDDGLKAGDAVEFKATIKEHADYKGTKQTIISRATLKKS